jgi:hypothetical protein
MSFKAVMKKGILGIASLELFQLVLKNAGLTHVVFSFARFQMSISFLASKRMRLTHCFGAI